MKNQFAIRGAIVLGLFSVMLQVIPCAAGELLDPGGVIEHMVASPVGNLLYATLENNDIIQATFDSTSVNARVTLSENPGALAVSPDGSKLYVILEDTYDVAVYNTLGLSYVTTIDLSADVYGDPKDLVATNSRLYVACSWDDLLIVDTSTYTEIFYGTLPQLLFNDARLALSPDEQTLAIGRHSSPASIYLVDVSEDEPVYLGEDCCHGPLGSGINGMEFSADASLLYFASSDRFVHSYRRDQTGIIYRENAGILGDYAAGIAVTSDESKIFAVVDSDLVVVRTSDWLPFHKSPLQGSVERYMQAIVLSADDTKLAVAISYSSMRPNRIEMIDATNIPANRGGIRARPLDNIEQIPIIAALFRSDDSSAESKLIDVRDGIIGSAPHEAGEYQIDLDATSYDGQTLNATVVAGQWTDLGEIQMTRTGDFSGPYWVGASPAGVVGSTVDVVVHGVSFHPDATLLGPDNQSFVFESFTWVDWSTINATVTAPPDLWPGLKSYQISVQNPGGSATWGPIVFVEGDAKLLQFSAGTAQADEGAGTVDVEVTRTGPSAGAVGVDYQTVDGSAQAGLDYTADSGTLNWGDGDVASKTITIDISQDTDIEGDENFTIELSIPTGGAVLGDLAVSTVTILDDDDSTVELASATAQVDETAGTFSIEVTRTGDLSTGASVAYATVADSATDGDDYSGVSSTLSWGAGDGSTQNIDVNILDDVLHEGNEGFSIVLSSPSGNATLGANAETVVTIVDDDQPAFRLATDTVVVAEGAGFAAVEVLRVGPLNGSYSVDYATADGSASAGSDYTATSGALTWADGVGSSQTVQVPITGDSELEIDENFTFALSNASGGAAIYEPSIATVTITDDDCALHFQYSTLGISEDGNAIDVAVQRIGRLSESVSVSYSVTGGSATASEDYVPVSGTLNWPADDGSDRSFPFIVIDDDLIEGGETVVIELSNPQGPATVGTPSSLILNIADDDWNEFRVNTTVENQQTRPSVSMDGTGASVTAWDSYEQDGDGWGVFAIRHDPDGQLIGAEFRLSVITAGHQRDVKVASAADGRFAAVWSGPDVYGSGIYLRRFAAGAVAQGNEVLVNTTTTFDQVDPAVAMDDQGRILVIWESFDADGSGIFAQAYTADGTAVGGERRLNQVTAGDQLLPAVSALPGVGFVAVWESVGQDGPASGIIGRRLGTTGVPLENEWIANTYTSGEQQRPAVAGTADGLVVVWQDANNLDGDGWSIRLQRFDVTAAKVGPEIAVNQYGAGTQGDPTVSMDGDGAALVGWESDGQDGSSMGVYLRIFWPDGLVSSEFQANLYTVATQDEIDVACAPDGTYFAVWASGGQDGSGDGVYGVRARIPFRTHIFSDGFESGDILQWSNATP